MDAAQLVQVESLCETLYNSSDEAARSHAQNQLLSLQTSAERIPQCQYILDHSENAYALLLASSSLTRLISNHWNNFTTPQRVEIRNYILNYLGSVGASLTDYVRTSLIQLLCRITKLGWFDDQRHREVVDAVMRFLQVSVFSVVRCVCSCLRCLLSRYPRHEISFRVFGWYWSGGPTGSTVHLSWRYRAAEQSLLAEGAARRPVTPKAYVRLTITPKNETETRQKEPYA